MAFDMERLLDAVRQTESGGNPQAISPRGAEGPYQFMPATAKQYGVSNSFDETQARNGARSYFTALLRKYNNDVGEALVAWNWGPGNLDKFGWALMPRESRDFLSKVMTRYSDSTPAISLANQSRPASNIESLFPGAQPASSSALGELFPGSNAGRQASVESLFPNNQQNDALRASVLQPKSADTAARIYQMQLQTGLPPGLIAQNLDSIEQQAKQVNFDAEKFRQESPLLAGWLAKNPVQAAVAQGDYENLSTLETAWQIVQAVPAGFTQGGKDLRSSMLSFKVVMGDITPQEEAERRQLKIDAQAAGQQFAEGWPSWAKSAGGLAGQMVPMALESVKAGVKYGVPAGALIGAASMVGGRPAGAALGTIAGFKTAAQISFVDQNYRANVGQAFDTIEGAKDANGNPVDPIVARYAALLVGAPDTVFGMVALRKIAGLLPGADKLLGTLGAQGVKQLLTRPSVTAALVGFGKKYAGAVGSQTFAMGMQQVMNIFAREIATGDLGKGINAEDVNAVASGTANAFKGIAVLGLLPSGPKVFELYHDMKVADKNEAFMHELGAAVSDSKTYARSPEAMKDYVSALKENGPVKDVFIPVEKWNALFQSEAPTAAKEVFGDLKQYAEAVATGGDLVIPIDLYAQKLAGTPFHERLVPDIRLNPGEMTPREAQEAKAAEPQILSSLEAEMVAIKAKEAPLVQVYNDVYDKLKTIGVGTAEANRDALLWRERTRARAERLGVDPWAFYQENPLTVQREMPAAMPEELKAYNQQLVEPAVPFAQKLPLPEGQINLPAATPRETNTATEAIRAAEKSHEEYGVYGATIHPTKGDQSGTHGVAVAGYPQRGVVTEGIPTKQEVETFMRHNRGIFNADKNAALGVWVDNESGKGYLDITNVLPRDKAIAQGEYLGEKAVWDLGHSQEIRLPIVRETGQRMLFQNERGASVPVKGLIVLLKNADPSTFIHESGHLWLEELRTDATRPDAPEQLVKDWNTIKEWAGTNEQNISTEAHEKFARGFEAYIMEGKAPSFQLRETFAQLKDWLFRIYKSMTMLDVPLTPEVREVMDRLLATDEAVKQVREHNAYDVPFLDQTKMTEAEYKAYRELNAQAKSQAEDTFRVQVMKELRRERLAEWRKEKEAMTGKVREDILQIPIYRAAYWLWSGKLPDGTSPLGLGPFKLDKQSLIDMGVKPTDLPFRYQENGLHPDTVAELFGFSSGKAFVKELIGLPTLKKAIDAEVDTRMKQEHGDLIFDGSFMDKAGMEVQNTRQIDVFNFEMRILKRMGATREITHPAIMKDLARQIIERKTLGELNPKLFEAAALKASQEAEAAMLGREFRAGTGRNLDTAFDAKQRQLLNVLLYREAATQRELADKAVKKWNKFLFRTDERLSKTHNMDMVNAARSIAAAHGIGAAQETADSYMRTLAEYDPQSYDDLHNMVEMAAADGRPVNDLTVSDFGIVRDAIEGLWSMARRTNQIEIDGKRLDRAQVLGELGTRISELVPTGTKRAGYDHAVGPWEKVKIGLLGAKAMLRRIESWVDAMDNGDPNGVFRRYVWQPVSEAADLYRDKFRAASEKYQAIVNAAPKEIFRAGKIDAPEIGYQFRDKTELLGAIMHTGNDSNKFKLLADRQRKWGDINGEGLDSHRWDAFIKRMQDEGVLTKADYDFAQAIGNLFEELKPEAQKAHKDMYGYYFDEVTKKPFDTPFGTYDGWYYPAITDPFIVEDAAIRAEQRAMESRPSSFIFPSTGRDFAHRRDPNYAKPLSLDLGLIQQHIGKVLRFTYLEPHVKDVGRVIVNKDFRASLALLDTEIAQVALVPWLQRSALQQVEQPSGPRMQAFDKFFHQVRLSAGLQIMFANASVTLQQFTGPIVAAAQDPKSIPYMSTALWHYVSAPRDYVAHINEASMFMRNQNSSQVMEIQRSIDNIVLNPNPYQTAKAFANQHGHFMEAAAQNIVNYIVWGGRYDRAIAEGYDHNSAVRQANSSIRETQGTFAAEDISRFESGTAFKRLFTMFYSYFNMAANLNGTEFVKAMRQGGFAGAGRALYVFTMGFMIPAVLSEAITQVVGGQFSGEKSDEEDVSNILSVFFGGQFKQAAAMVPIVGPVAQVAVNAFNDKWYDDRIQTSPAVSMLESLAHVPVDAYKVATEDEARLKRPIQDALTAIGLVSGLPVAPLSRPLGYMADVSQGYTEPAGPIETTRGLISGRTPK